MRRRGVAGLVVGRQEEIDDHRGTEGVEERGNCGSEESKRKEKKKNRQT